MGREFVGSAVPREEGDRDVVVLKDMDWRRWVTPWCERVNGSGRCVAFERLEAGTADYCDVDGT